MFFLLRTLRAQFLIQLSHVLFPSDSACSFSGPAVSCSSSFGLRVLIFQFSCLMFFFLRTLRAHLLIQLSHVLFPSDFACAFFSLAVPSSSCFGLRVLIFQFSCLKFFFLRTLSAHFSVQLSQVLLASDSAFAFFSSAVPSSSCFGLFVLISLSRCPKGILL